MPGLSALCWLGPFTLKLQNKLLNQQLTLFSHQHSRKAAMQASRSMPFDFKVTSSHVSVLTAKRTTLAATQCLLWHFAALISLIRKLCSLTAFPPCAVQCSLWCLYRDNYRSWENWLICSIYCICAPVIHQWSIITYQKDRISNLFFFVIIKVVHLILI